MKHLRYLNEGLSFDSKSLEELEDRLKWLYIERGEINDEMEKIKRAIKEKTPVIIPDEKISGEYRFIRKELPKFITDFCDDINNQFNKELEFVIYNKTQSEIEFWLDAYSEEGMNKLVKIVKKVVKDPKFKNMFAVSYIEDELVVLINKTET